MTADSFPRVSSSESDSSTTKQRKKRKWDQPDESLVSTSVAIPGVFPQANVGSLSRITLPTVSSLAGASLVIPPPTSSATPVQAVQVPLQQHAAAIIQKLVQPKIQDELIAREIVINDADSAIRYKLTKRQTQEEIQKSTGAVVITRGKYRPPYAPSDGERPLYLHISAATHLETTAERIKAVDHAAALVEEMLKQATLSGGVKAGHLLTTSVFLGFEPDPSLDIISRIRGPNDQYVNHIMNETGATVLIRGRGSGYPDNGPTEETQQQLHLLLSSNNTNSLQHAKLLAENLLDTICGECGSSRISSCKVYGAVPPPPQLQTGVHSPTSALTSTALPGVSIVPSQGPPSQSIGISNVGISQAKVSPPCYPQGWTSGTSYNGYGGIYPQVTALQQVALALRQSTSPVTATVATATTAASTYPQKEVPHLANDKRSQKRKFQEIPVGAKGTANLNQGTEFPTPSELTSHVGAKDILAVQERKRIAKSSSSEMPPPPPKFDSTPKLHEDNRSMQKSKAEAVPDTLIKLMEYGDDDDDDDDEVEETNKLPSENHLSSPAVPKPFWAARK